MAKPCVKCGSTERYKNGDCAPCTRLRAKRHGNDLDYIKKWQHKNAEKVKAYKAKWQKSEEGRKYQRKYTRKWREQNYEKFTAQNREAASRRRTRCKQATPQWADKELIELIYLECPDGCHVDHVVPLNNDRVCGLHVQDNLQYLTKQENQRKYNHWDYYGES